MNPNVYWQLAGPQIRRAMTLQDMNPQSPTFGCCDRAFWQYRTISGFPAGTMQMLALPFAVLFCESFPENTWHRDPEMLERARSGMLFWARSQHACGAVDEWYRNERSYCATAFTTYGVSEALLRVQADLSKSDREEIQGGVERAARWLAGRFNPHAMNQNLAACAALWNADLCLGTPCFKAACETTWERTKAHQDPEGWFSEYGGSDPGYSLLALDLLAALDRRGWAKAVASAEPLGTFVESLACGEGHLAEGLGSRGTEHGFPYGVEAFGPRLAHCARIARHLRTGLASGTLSHPALVDDRYFAYFYLPSFILAASVEHAVSKPENLDREVHWPRAGFHVWRRGPSDVVCSFGRAGAFNVYGSEIATHRNMGYWAVTEDGRRWASCAWLSNRPTEHSDTAATVTAEGPFVRVDDALPLVRWEMSFRALTLSLFRFRSIAEFFHRQLRLRRIARKRTGRLSFARQLEWKDGSLFVRDSIRRTTNHLRLRSLHPGADIEVHSPSARMGPACSFERVVVSQATAEAWAQEINRAGRLELTSVYSCDPAGRLRFESIQSSSRDRAGQ